MSASPLQSLLSEFGFGSSNTRPFMDWKETHEAHIFKFDLPGLTKEEVKLQVHDDKVLHVSAERKQEENDIDNNNKNAMWHCRERVADLSFAREFRLPENANVDQIKASMSDGVLVVTVPKDHSKKKKHVKGSVEIVGEEGKSKGLARFVCCNCKA